MNNVYIETNHRNVIHRIQNTECDLRFNTEDLKIIKCYLI